MAAAPSNIDQIKAKDEIECAICLQTCIHPAKLPCGHIFCFLCIKGIANQSKKCAMCRKEIPIDFLDNPSLVISSNECRTFESEEPHPHAWYYEGRNGWWQYDERTCKELEAAHKSTAKTCELLIAGFLYIIDFENMIQMRRNVPSRCRKIKRDLLDIPNKLGIAGLKLKSQGAGGATDGGGSNDLQNVKLEAEDDFLHLQPIRKKRRRKR